MLEDIGLWVNLAPCDGICRGSIDAKPWLAGSTCTGIIDAAAAVPATV